MRHRLTSSRGEAATIVLIAIAAIGIAIGVFRPAWLPGASKRAQNSTQATAKLEQATNAQAGAAAASVVKIGEANAQSPASPSRDFIAKEVPVALSRLPSPDPKELIEAERRKAAVMEGRLEESRKLYEDAAKRSEKLQQERDEALKAREAADLALEKAAAAEHARTMQIVGIGVLLVLVTGGWIYTKFHSVGPDALGKIAARLRMGEAPISVLDDPELIPKRLRNRVRNSAKLATDFKD